MRANSGIHGVSALLTVLVLLSPPVTGRLLAGVAPRFATAAGADRQRPQLTELQLVVADGCAVLRLAADEAVDLLVEPGWSGGRAAVAAPRHELGLPLPTSWGPSAVAYRWWTSPAR